MGWELEEHKALALEEVVVEMVEEVERRDCSDRDCSDRDCSGRGCSDRGCSGRDCFDRDCMMHRDLGLGTLTSHCLVHAPSSHQV